MKRLIILGCIGLLFNMLLLSCRGEFDIEKESLLQGKLSSSNQEWIYLNEIDIKKLDLIDSAKLDKDGNFRFVFENKNKQGFYTLNVGRNSNPVVLMIETGEKVVVEGDAQKLSSTYIVKNSKGSEILRDFYQKANNSIARADSLYFNYREFKFTGDSLVKFRIYTDSMMRLNQILHYNMVKEMALANKNSLASIIILYSKFGDVPVLDFELDFDIFKSISQSLNAKYPENVHVIDLKNRVNDLLERKNQESNIEKSLSTGKYFPQLELLDKDNQSRQLIDSLGNTKLILFWNSVDTNCWNLNEKLLKLYNKYSKSKKFEVYAISMDIDKIQWLNAINFQKNNWINVIGQSDTREKFNVKEMPRMFLIDANGLIINKDFDFQQLETYLNQL